jgi:hypothetical protein
MTKRITAARRSHRTTPVVICELIEPKHEPPRTLSWSASRPDVITENTGPVDATEATPVAVLHKPYDEARLRVLGQTELGGRSVLSLASHPGAKTVVEASLKEH